MGHMKYRRSEAMSMFQWLIYSSNKKWMFLSSKSTQWAPFPRPKSINHTRWITILNKPSNRVNQLLTNQLLNSNQLQAVRLWTLKSSTIMTTKTQLSMSTSQSPFHQRAGHDVSFFAFVWKKKGRKKTSGMNLHIKKPGNQVGHLVWLSRGGGGGACPNQPNTFRALISLTPLFTAVINGITRVRVFMSIVYNIKGGARLAPEMYQCFTGWPLERG